tara:strand:- start:15108 stop:15713 length:606 start_codon:yes stop_codon:yes gene_type:complete
MKSDKEGSERDAADKAAMTQLREGNDLALNAIMEHWEQPLLSFLYRYTTNWSVAVDLAQETFVKVFQSRMRYRPKGQFSTWLFSIAMNLARNEARWRKRNPQSAMSGAAEDERQLAALDSAEIRPDDAAAGNDRARMVREAIRELPGDLRTVVLLSEYEGMTQREIGDVLGCTPKAVETRLYRARKLLRDKLKDAVGDVMA